MTRFDQIAADRAAARQATLTKPAGSLGRLEALAVFMAGWQGTDRPTLDRAQALVFAGNHGITAQGVTPFPPAVTAAMVANFRAGGAAINQLCRVAGADLGIVALDLDRPTADFTQGPAMTSAEVDDAMAQGRIDLYISTAGKHAPDTKVQNLFSTSFMGAAREDHPLFDEEISAERFAACDHIAVSRRGLPRGPIDDDLATLGLQRRVALISPTFHGAIFAAAESDLILPQMPSVMLERIVSMRLPLRLFPLPIPVRTAAIVQAWHPRLDNDAAHQWLRRSIKTMCERVEDAHR